MADMLDEIELGQRVRWALIEENDYCPPEPDISRRHAFLYIVRERCDKRISNG